MKKIKLLLTLIILTGIIGLQACATMFGGSKYTAYINTNDQDATILVDNKIVGTGQAQVLQKRKKPLDVEVQSQKCDDFEKEYPKRFRGTIFLNLLWTYYLWIPTAVVDITTGSIYKPDTRERGVDKVTINQYRYTIDLENCKVQQ